MAVVAEFAGQKQDARYYTLRDAERMEQVPSVTTVLNGWPKPWMGPWSSAEERKLVIPMARDYTMGYLRSRHAEALQTLMPMVRTVGDVPVVPVAVLQDLLNPERTLPSEVQWLAGLDAHVGQMKGAKRKNKAATDRGKLAHAKIEHKIAQLLGATDLPPWPVSQESPEENDAAEIIFMQWEDHFLGTLQFKPEHVEVRVGSFRVGTAGTIDAVGTFTYEGERLRGTLDWKGSKAIYTEAKIQGGVYRRMWNESHPWEASGMEPQANGHANVVVVARFPSSFDQPEFLPSRDVLVMGADRADRYADLFPHLLAIHNAHAEAEEARTAAERAVKAQAKADAPPKEPKPRAPRKRKAEVEQGDMLQNTTSPLPGPGY